MRTYFSLGLGLALLFVCRMAHAQSVQALVNSSTIGTQEAVTYSIEVTGADIVDVSIPMPPAAPGLQLVSPAPSRGTSVSWVNGNVTRTATYSWQYQPLAEGQAHIESATVDIADTTYTTSAISITVVPQSQRPSRTPGRRSIFDPFPIPAPGGPVGEIAERDVFIRVIPSSTTPFVNEQVTISYELFFREGMQPQNSRLADSWDAEGFWREDLPVEGRPMPRTSIQDGLRYSSIVVKRVAVFPTRPGSLTIDPLRIATKVVAPGTVGFGGSLFSRRAAYQEIERSSPPVAMEVKPLPSHAPDGYRDAVGKYTLEARLSRTQVDVGEPLELVIRITGEGNISTLDGPEVQLPGVFESYDPEINTVSRVASNLAGGTKTFTFLMIPRANGTFNIPAFRFSYLDPATAAYQTIERMLPAIRVSGTAAAAVPTSTLATGFPVDDIAGPRAAERWVTYPPVPLHRRWWIFVAIAMPLLVLTTLAAWRRRATRLQTDVAWARGRQAHPLARRHLKRAMQLSERDAPRPFFVELENAVLGFIGNRMNVAELGMTRPHLYAALAEAGVSESTRNRLHNFLMDCDAARFAPDRPDRARMDSAMQAAIELIVLIDQSAHP